MTLLQDGLAHRKARSYCRRAALASGRCASSNAKASVQGKHKESRLPAMRRLMLSRRMFLALTGCAFAPPDP